MNKLFIICGPTATGKTDLGIRLAKKFNGEIISADSRQVYRGMDIITGKDLPVNSELKTLNLELQINDNKFTVGYRLKEGIPIWLTDIIEPNYPFNAGEFSLLARKVIADIWMRKKLPIVVGGTGLYIKSIIDPLGEMSIPPIHKIREELKGATPENLQQKLILMDKDKWEKMNQSDKNNSRRLVRAIEIAVWRQNHPQKSSTLNLFKFDTLLMIGLRTSSVDVLYPIINKRVEERLKNGVLEEVRFLMDKKYSPHLPALTSTGVKDLREYLEGKETLADAVRRWKINEHRFAQKQMVWFKKDKRIQWFNISEKNYIERIEKMVAEWYTSKS